MGTRTWIEDDATIALAEAREQITVLRIEREQLWRAVDAHRNALAFLLGHQDSVVVAATQSALRRYQVEPNAATKPWWA